MTLNDLIRKAQGLASQLSSGDVELYDGVFRIEDIDFEFMIDEEKPLIQMTVK